MTRDCYDKASCAGPFPFLGAPGLPQQVGRKDQLALATGKWAAAGTARHLANSRSEIGFDFD